MTETGDLHRRTARLEEQVRELADPVDDDYVLVWGGAHLRGDPRLAALIAAARAEGRRIVAPWSEDEDGNLVDHEDEAHRGSFARDDAEADRYARENLATGRRPVTPRT